MKEILKYFPKQIAYVLEKNIGENWNKLEEIRIRTGKPIILKFQNKEIIIEQKILIETILEIMQYICDNSIYSYQEQICNGFITIKGGHRVGITGSAVIQNRKSN